MSLILYEHSTSVCVLKVRLTLFEKGIDYEGRFVDLRGGGQFDPDYLKIHPGAVVPAMVHDGHILRESSVIQYYLEDAFSGPPLMPLDPLARYRVRWFMKYMDDPIHPACGLLTHAIAFRKDYNTPDAIDARMAKIPDPRRRMRQRSVYELGLDSPFMIDAVKDYQGLISEMETALADAPFLGGDAYSLADAAATPYINRLFILGVLGAWAEDNPRCMDWFDRIRARPSFDAAITRHFTDADADYMRPVDDDVADRVAVILAANLEG
jgi:glutathione S-transferase